MSYWERARGRAVGRRRLLIGAGAGMAAILAACGGDSSGDNGGSAGAVDPGAGGASFNTAGQSGGEQPKYGGTLTVGLASDPRSADPHLGTGGADHQRLYPIYDNLVTYDSNGQLDPSISLAEKWEQFDDRVVLKLRQGVSFHDGAPFTAEDVKWNLERQLDPATRATDRPNLLVIDRVEVSSPTEVVLRLKEPSAPLLTNFGERAGMMISRTTYDKIGKDAFQRAGVGTGPFMLKEWVSDAYMLYEKNPRYWRKDAQGRDFPYLNQIRLETMPDATVRVAALESGDIDLLGLGTPGPDVKRLNDLPNLQWARFVGDATSLFFATHGWGPTANLEFRKAVVSALNKQAYIKNFLSGDEQVAGSVLPPGTWAHTPGIDPYPYDLTKAKQYLAASGIPAAEARLKGCINPPQTETHQFWEASLKEAGIGIDWIIEQGASLKYLYVNFGGNSTATFFFGGYSLKADPDAAITAFYTPAGSYNAAATVPSDIEALVLKGRVTLDTEERKKIYAEIQRKGTEQVLAYWPVAYGIQYAHASKKVGNLEYFFGGEAKDRYANLWI